MGTETPVTVDHARLAELAAGILEAGSALCFAAPGSSMYPFIYPGDTIEVRPLGPCGPRRMDILLFRRPGGRVAAHRLIRIVHDAAGVRLALRGDAPPYDDELIAAGDVLGQVTACEHNGRLRRFDRPWMRGLGRLWVLSAPLGYYAVKLLVGCRNFVRREGR